MSIKLLLKRFEMNMTCTVGTLYVDGYPLFTTLERPWVNNEPNVSCIPTGNYTCNWTDSERAGNLHGKLVGIDYVKGRTNIRIHVGNFVEDSLGCILLGTGLDIAKGVTCITSSRSAHNRFLKLMAEKEDIPLTIVNCDC